MKKIETVSSWLVGLVSAAATALGVEIATSYVPATAAWVRVIVITIFPLLSIMLVHLAIKVMLMSRIGRRILMSGTWVEGWWYIRTFDDEFDNPISPGLMCVGYRGSDLDLFINVYRPGLPESDPMPFVTRSHMTSMREADLQLLNYCVFPEEKGEGRSLGIGNFVAAGPVTPPGRYEGTVIRVSEVPFRRQSALKVPHRTIKRCQKEHGDKWIAALIGEYRSRETRITD